MSILPFPIIDHGHCAETGTTNARKDAQSVGEGFNSIQLSRRSRSERVVKCHKMEEETSAKASGKHLTANSSMIESTLSFAQVV